MNTILQRYTKTAMGVLVLACSHQIAWAKNKVYTPKYKISQDLMFDAHIAGGMQSVLGNEYVYYPPENRTVSKLIWDTKSLMMMGIGGSVSLQNKYTLNADYWFSMSKGDTTMTDYDWLVQGYDWTHRSIHPDTDVSSASSFDINAEVNALKVNGTTFAALVGYRQDSYEWQAHGGTFLYSVNGFRDTKGKIKDGLLGITYKQTWKSTYLGFKADTQLTNMLNIHGKFIYAPSVDAEAIDHHHLRNIVAVDTFKDTTMFALDVGIAYKVSPALHIDLSYKYQKFDTVVGDTAWKENNQVRNLAEYAGADLETSMLSVAAYYTF